MGELKKYAIRFGFLIIALVLALLTLPSRDAGLFLYKISLVLVGIGLSEIVWMLFFKIIFGSVERLDYDTFKTVFMGRIILYSSIIIALSMGL